MPSRRKELLELLAVRVEYMSKLLPKIIAMMVILQKKGLITVEELTEVEKALQSEVNKTNSDSDSIQSKDSR
jgi:ABC-type spermidine/putrescine transport system permease subunit I